MSAVSPNLADGGPDGLFDCENGLPFHLGLQPHPGRTCPSSAPAATAAAGPGTFGKGMVKVRIGRDTA